MNFCPPHVWVKIFSRRKFLTIIIWYYYGSQTSKMHDNSSSTAIFHMCNPLILTWSTDNLVSSWNASSSLFNMTSTIFMWFALAAASSAFAMSTSSPGLLTQSLYLCISYRNDCTVSLSATSKRLCCYTWCIQFMDWISSKWTKYDVGTMNYFTIIITPHKNEQYTNEELVYFSGVDVTLVG